MNKLIAFFPEVVYYCDCLQKVIGKCKRPRFLKIVNDFINLMFFFCYCYSLLTEMC